MRGGFAAKWMCLSPLAPTPAIGFDKEDMWIAEEGGSFRMLREREYDDEDLTNAGLQQSAAGPMGSLPSPMPAALQASMAFQRRVDGMAAMNATDPVSAAIKGAAFSARGLHPSERRLFERLRDMRPPHHNRPLSRKMAAKMADETPPTIDALLKASRLPPMPTIATQFGGEGLAAALLVADLGVADDSEMCTMAVLQLERFMRLAVDDPEITVKDMLLELRVALMDRLMHELATFHNLDFRDEVMIRDGHWFLQCWVRRLHKLAYLPSSPPRHLLSACHPNSLSV